MKNFEGMKNKVTKNFVKNKENLINKLKLYNQELEQDMDAVEMELAEERKTSLK